MCILTLISFTNQLKHNCTVHTKTN